MASPRLPAPSTFTTTPPVGLPSSAIFLMAARAPRIVPTKFVLTMATMSSSAISVMGLRASP